MAETLNQVQSLPYQVTTPQTDDSLIYENRPSPFKNHFDRSQLSLQRAVLVIYGNAGTFGQWLFAMH